MCGRTCCTLTREVMPYACATGTGKRIIPEWREAPDGGQYFPSNNIPPTRYTPILLRGSQVGAQSELVIQPMLWSLIPTGFAGNDPTKHGLTTNNARLEGLSQSKLYKIALTRNRRCVVLADGFYEWKKLNASTKQPYLIFAPNDTSETPIQDCADCTLEKCWSEETGWMGPKPLFMAGIYSVWKSPEGLDVYSYTIITRESNEEFAWLHSRVPAILFDEDDVQAWLDPSQEGFQALEVLKPLTKGQLKWHPVSQSVGNVRNQESGLQKPIELDSQGKAKDTKSGSASIMSNWLNKSNPTAAEPRAKKPKVE